MNLLAYHNSHLCIINISMRYTTTFCTINDLSCQIALDLCNVAGFHLLIFTISKLSLTAISHSNLLLSFPCGPAPLSHVATSATICKRSHTAISHSNLCYHFQAVPHRYLT